MSSYRRDERDRRFERDTYNFHDRRDGERDRRDFDRDRSNRDSIRDRSRSRERGARDWEKDDRPRADRLEGSKLPSGPRDLPPRPPPRSFSSPVHSRLGVPTEPRLDRGRDSSPPRRQTAVPTTPASSAPPTPKPTHESTHLGKITRALRTVTKRSYEQVAIQLRKDVVETRSRDRENNRKVSQHKYQEFPSLKETHRKAEKKDNEDLAALRKEEEEADGKTLESAEHLASTLLQVVAELQQEKDSRAGTTSAQDGLEARLNSRLELFEKQHREDTEKQQKRFEELQNGLSAEKAQCKALGIENESLKTRLLELEKKNEALQSMVDDHKSSIERLRDDKQEAAPTQPTLDSTIQAQHAAQLQTLREECVGSITELKAKVSEHDTKLGEMDIELISESCDAIVTKLPRFEQNVKKATDDILLLRSDTEQLRTHTQQLQSSTEKLQLGTEQLQTHTQQLQSSTEKLQSDTEQLRSNQEQLRSDQEQLRSEVKRPQPSTEQPQSDTEHLKSSLEQLRSGLEQLQSEIKQLREGDKFLTTAVFKNLNEKAFVAFGGWVDTLKKRCSELESQTASLQTLPAQMKDHDTRTKTLEKQVGVLQSIWTQRKGHGPDTSGASSRTPEPKKMLPDTKWGEHVERIKAPGNANDPEQKHASFVETTSRAIETLKKQLAMSDQSLKAVSEAVRLTTEDQNRHRARLGDIDSDLSRLSTRVGALEQNLRMAEEKLEKRLDFVQQGYMSLDTQMNNLTTESLFSAIIQHLDKYQPSEAQLGSKVETIIQQMTQHEQRLVKVERTTTSGDEPTSKKRKLSPNSYGSAALTNGNGRH